MGAGSESAPDEALLMPGALQSLRHRQSDPKMSFRDPVQDASSTRCSAAISFASSVSTESLVTALSGFPPTPERIIKPQPSFESQATWTQESYNKSRSRSASNGSSTNSDDTLIADNSRASTAPTSPSPTPINLGDDLDDDFKWNMQRPASRLSHYSLSSFDDFDESYDISDEKVAGNADDFEAVLSYLDFQAPPSAEAAGKADPDRLRSLTHDFESHLSCFRSTASELTGELAVHLGDDRSKLDDLLLTSVRKTTTQALEAMVMVSWFRETKLQNEPSILVQEKGAPNGPLDEQASKEQIMVNDLVEKVNAGLGEKARRNGFEAASRDGATLGNPGGKSLSPALSIEDLAKARSATPLHFDRHASIRSQRRFLAHTPKLATNGTRARSTSLSTTAVQHKPSLHADLDDQVQFPEARGPSSTASVETVTEKTHQPIKRTHSSRPSTAPGSGPHQCPLAPLAKRNVSEAVSSSNGAEVPATKPAASKNSVPHARWGEIIMPLSQPRRVKKESNNDAGRKPSLRSKFLRVFSS